MRTTKNFARRSSALVLAGALAFAGAACSDDEPTDVDVTEEGDVEEGDDVDVEEGDDVDVTEEEEDAEGTEEATE